MVKNFYLNDKKCLYSSTNLLEEIFTSIDERSIQKILREADTFVLPKALSGASGNVLMCIYRNMGDRGAMLLDEEIHWTEKEIPEHDIIENQKKIIEVFTKLKEQDEINFLDRFC